MQGLEFSQSRYIFLVCVYFNCSIKDTKKRSGSQRLYCLLVLAFAAIIAVSVALAVVVIRENEDDDKPSAQSGAEANIQRGKSTHPASTKATTAAAMMNHSNTITLTRGLSLFLLPPNIPANNTEVYI